MAEYISSFTTGFEEVIAYNISRFLKGAIIIDIFDGMIRYKYDGNPNSIENVAFFNNTFNILKFYKNKNISFNHMISDISSKRNHYLRSEGTFRIRFSKGNQFSKVDKNLSLKAESLVCKFTHLRIDRLNPSTELWYVIRDEGFGFYGQLLKKRTTTEKSLNKGELRPEFAFLMCCCVEHTEKSIIMDPFAGFGAIPMQIMNNFPFNKLIINDLDTDNFKKLKLIFPKRESRINIYNQDALNQVNISNENIDYIITDPPWGYYEDIGDIKHFYENMLIEFKRVLKSDGTIVLLSARKEEFVEVVNHLSSFSIIKTLNTLVNGKKSSVYILKPIKKYCEGS